MAAEAAMIASVAAPSSHRFEEIFLSVHVSS